MSDQTKKDDILGDGKKPKVEIKKEEKKREPNVGEIVFFSASEESSYPAIVNKVHASGAADLAVFMETFINFVKKVPFSKTKTSGSYRFHL